MKYLFIFVFLFLVCRSFAQESKDMPLIQIVSPVVYNDVDVSQNLEIPELKEGTKLYAFSTGEDYFYRSYLVDMEGKSVSDGFMPRSYFMPNDNFLVITAAGNMAKDTFNPYGAYDMPSMLILGTFNNFISRISRSKR